MPPQTSIRSRKGRRGVACWHRGKSKKSNRITVRLYYEYLYKLQQRIQGTFGHAMASLLAPSNDFRLT